MSAAAKVKRPPDFTTYTEVEVEIDAEDLESEGWVYVSKGKGARDSATATTLKVIDTVRLWHDEEHDLPWRWCQHTLCHRLNFDPENTP